MAEMVEPARMHRSSIISAADKDRAALSLARKALANGPRNEVDLAREMLFSISGPRQPLRQVLRKVARVHSRPSKRTWVWEAI